MFSINLTRQARANNVWRKRKKIHHIQWYYTIDGWLYIVTSIFKSSRDTTHREQSKHGAGWTVRPGSRSGQRYIAKGKNWPHTCYFFWLIFTKFKYSNFFCKETSSGTGDIEEAKREEKSKATFRNQNAEVANNVETSDNLLIFSLILKSQDMTAIQCRTTIMWTLELCSVK